MRTRIANLPLKWKLVGSFGLILIVVVATLVAYSSWRQGQQAQRSLNSKALAVSTLVAQDVGAAYEFGDAASVLGVFNGAKTHSGADYLVLVKPDGTAFAATEGAPAIAKAEASGTLTAPELEESARALKVRVPIVTNGGMKGRLVASFGKEESEQERRSYQATAVLIGLVMLAAGLFVAYVIGDYVARRLSRLGRAMAAVASGDLTEEIADPTHDEIGALAGGLNTMKSNLRDLASQIKKGSAEINASSIEIFASTREQEQSAAQQASAIEETRRTMESLLAAFRTIAESADAVLANAEMTLKNNQLIAERYEQLSLHIQRITEILDVIRGIANKSDLLALNASLEGTKAGEAGRGFSLVAAQMQRLAENVMDSVQDIKKLIGDISEASHAAAVATEQGARLADQTTQSARQIRVITHQQQAGTEQVSQSMSDATMHLAQSTNGMSQIAAAMKSLTDLSVQLNDTVKVFKIPKAAV